MMIWLNIFCLLRLPFYDLGQRTKIWRWICCIMLIFHFSHIHCDSSTSKYTVWSVTLGEAIKQQAVQALINISWTYDKFWQKSWSEFYEIIFNHSKQLLYSAEHWWNYYLCHSIHKHDISSVYSYHAVITENALIPL